MGKKGKRGAKEKAATSFPLSLQFVVFPNFVPALILGCVTLLLHESDEETAGPIVIRSLTAVVAGLVLFRLPSVIRTVLFDRHILLGKEVLHIPIVHYFQFSPRDIPFSDIESITTSRKSGSSTRIIITLRDGRQITFPSSYVTHYPTVVSTIERRLG